MAPDVVTWRVDEAREGDRPAWERLYREYAASAGTTLDDDHLDLVWSWIHDPGSQTRCLLLRTGADCAPVGLAHHRVFERPLAGSRGCWLDDLHVTEHHRGRGGAQAVLAHLAALARSEGWSTVRWTTGADNPAQHLYDSVAERNPVLTFDLVPAGRG